MRDVVILSSYPQVSPNNPFSDMAIADFLGDVLTPEETPKRYILRSSSLLVGLTLSFSESMLSISYGLHVEYNQY